MLSINIPIYNFKVNKLVHQILNQVDRLTVPCEIRLYDDGSAKEFIEHNAALSDNRRVIFKAMEHNLGRAAIRNKMGQDAQYQYLLFIDADSLLVKDDYLQSYLNEIKSNTVLCGGTQYAKSPPKDPSEMLRWHYGSAREAISATQRNSKKGFIITSNNFMIEKAVFMQTPFREELKKYGHEDTLLGFDLFKKGVTIQHIENAVEHTGLENAEQFITKTEKGLENLKYIYEELLNYDDDFGSYVNFLKRYKKITPDVLSLLFRLSKKAIKHNLKSKKPNLALFDAYKVGYYSNL